MQSRVDEIAPDVFRLSAFNPDFGLQFNQFLIRDDEPVLIHTGFKASFDITLEPKTLATMHGSSYRGDGRAALLELTEIINELLGPRASSQS